MPTERISFNDHFSGSTCSSENSIQIELGKFGAKPYELAMTALVSCFYSTFMDVALKKRLEWKKVDIDINWSKDLESSPQFLKQAHLNISLEGDLTKEEKYKKSFELAAKYCSLYQTFSKVAELSWDLKITST